MAARRHACRQICSAARNVPLWSTKFAGIRAFEIFCWGNRVDLDLVLAELEYRLSGTFTCSLVSLMHAAAAADNVVLISLQADR